MTYDQIAANIVAEIRALKEENEQLRHALTEAAEELRWFLHETNSRGNEGPPRVWRLVNKIEELVPNERSSPAAKRSGAA